MSDNTGRTTPADLRQLIADIEDLSDPELEAPSGAQQKSYERYLSDKVLLACTRWRKHLEVWIDPKGHQQAERPDPLASLDDAKLAVPEGWWWVLNSGLSTGHALAQLGKEGGGMYGDRAEAYDPDPTRALALAGLKARLAEMEADHG